MLSNIHFNLYNLITIKPNIFNYNINKLLKLYNHLPQINDLIRIAPNDILNKYHNNIGKITKIDNNLLYINVNNKIITITFDKKRLNIIVIERFKKLILILIIIETLKSLISIWNSYLYTDKNIYPGIEFYNALGFTEYGSNIIKNIFDNHSNDINLTSYITQDVIYPSLKINQQIFVDYLENTWVLGNQLSDIVYEIIYIKNKIKTYNLSYKLNLSNKLFNLNLKLEPILKPDKIEKQVHISSEEIK